MYTYIVERTQIYLSRQQARALDREAKQRNTTRSHLIREAIDRQYGDVVNRQSFLETLEASTGAWKGRAETGEEYVERIRSGDRWRELWGDPLEDEPA
jgi:predicted transcriptional regulator